VADRIVDVIRRIPPEVRHVIVVDDASPDRLTDALATVSDRRLMVLRHDVNRGVGGAMKTGFAKALDLGSDIIVKIDGDGQMDPALIPRFVDPILSGEADFTKGNRFEDLSHIRRMPVVRRVGNLMLSFLVKLASGYWHSFDPTNGYVAFGSRVLRRMSFDRLADRYFFEISLLSEAYFAHAVLQDIPMKPVYAGETSSLNPIGSALSFTPRLVRRAFYRVFALVHPGGFDQRGERFGQRQAVADLVHHVTERGRIACVSRVRNRLLNSFHASLLRVKPGRAGDRLRWRPLASLSADPFAGPLTRLRVRRKTAYRRFSDSRW